MKRRHFFASLAAGAAGIAALPLLRFFRKPPGGEETKRKVTVTINPLAVPREQNGRPNG